MSTSRFPQTEAPPAIATEQDTGAPPLPAVAADANAFPAALRVVGRWLLRIVMLGAILAGAYLAFPYVNAQLTSLNKPPAADGKGSGGKGRGPVPVSVATVRQGDLPLYVNALGTVVGFKTATIRSRVDGELKKVSFTEGQMVEQGALLAEIDPRPFQVQLKQAEAQLFKDKAALRVATLDYNRYEKLVSTNAVTQQQLDATKGVMQQSQGAIEADEATIENVRLQLEYCRITAPFSGRIGLRTVDPGNIVHASDVGGMAVIAQLQPITVVFPIPQDDIVRVQKKIAEGKKLPVEAFDRAFERRLATGSLLALDNQVDATTGTVRIKAVFDNEDHLLFPNQFVNVRLLVDTHRDAVMIPSAAVQRGPQMVFVYVVQSNSTVKLRKVEVGPSEGDETVVESGLSPGEVVVTDGVDKLKDDAEVTLPGAKAEKS